MLEIVIGLAEVLSRFADMVPLVVPITCGLKVSVEGISVTAVLMPVPFRVMLCGLFPALSVSFTLPVLCPRVDGLK